MKRLRLVAFAWLFFACNPNHAELSDIQRDYDVQLASLQTVAQTLNERRRDTDAAESWLANPKGEPPPVKAFPPFTSFRPRSLPPPSVLETAAAQRQRDQISATERKARELERIVAEVRSIEKRRAELEEKIKKLRQLTPAP